MMFRTPVNRFHKDGFWPTICNGGLFAVYCNRCCEYSNQQEVYIGNADGIGLHRRERTLLSHAGKSAGKSADLSASGAGPLDTSCTALPRSTQSPTSEGQ